MLPQQQQNLTRVGDGVLYSTVMIGTGSLSSSSATFFGYGVGGGTAVAGAGTSVQATTTETNLRGAGSALPGGQAFSVHGISLRPFLSGAKTGIIAFDMHNLFDGSVLAWNWNQARIEIAPAVMCGGGGLFGINSGNTIATQSINIGNGGYYHFKSPIVLSPLAAFTIVWYWPASANALNAAVNARLTLIGSYDVAIEAG